MKKLIIFAALFMFVVSAFSQTLTSQRNQLPFRSSSLSASVQSLTPKSEAVLLHVDFSADNVGYSTGVITDGDEAHGQTAAFSMWNRCPGASDSVIRAFATNYSTLAFQYFGGLDNLVPYFQFSLDTTISSAENGWMFISPYDQSTPNTGNFNAYIQFDSIDVTSRQAIDFSLFQYYRGYFDHCYLDYSYDGVIWNEVEINDDRIIVGALSGRYTYTIFLGNPHPNTMSLRLRFKSLNSNHSIYGYYWIVDDVTVSVPPAFSLQLLKHEYVEGNYGMVPQGMAFNPAWYGLVKNNGIFTQYNTGTQLFHLDADQQERTLVSSFVSGTVNPSDFQEVMVDPSGWLSPDSLESHGWYGYINHSPNGTGTDLPTTVPGDHFLVVNVASDSLSFDCDTVYYQVTTADSNGNYTWAHDNGVLTYMPTNYWLFGFVQQENNWYATDDLEEVQFYMSGYSVTSRYTTDSIVPEDWVIKGVELVASPIPGFYSSGVKISPVLTKDVYTSCSVNFANIATGARVKQLTAADLNSPEVIGRDAAGYLTYGNYNTIFIPFPEQPALDPYTSYRIGYVLEEDGYFALAQADQDRYRLASPSRPNEYDTLYYFRNSDSTAKYAYNFPVNQYQTFVNDPSYGGYGSSGTFASIYVHEAPMIHMIVGPRTETPRVNIQIECNGYGQVRYSDQDVCGTTITPAVGSFVTLEAHTTMALALYVDGRHVDDYTAEFDDASGLYTYTYTFEDVSQDHQISFDFVICDQIDPIAAGVRLNLQPNPATSQVALNVEGVSGMVDCQLVDMSGRVVYNQKINAETTQVLSLSNLAKGAYFVRITNDKFSKVEKLIVR